MSKTHKDQLARIKKQEQVKKTEVKAHNRKNTKSGVSNVSKHQRKATERQVDQNTANKYLQQLHQDKDKPQPQQPIRSIALLRSGNANAVQDFEGWHANLTEDDHKLFADEEW